MSLAGSAKKAEQIPPTYRLVSSDELGLCKVVEVPGPAKWEAASIVKRWGQPEKEKAISSIAVSSGSDDPFQMVAVAHKGGSVSVLEYTDVQQVGKISPPASASRSEPPSIRGLSFLPVAGGTSRLLSAQSSGLLAIHHMGSGEDGAGEAEASTSGRSWAELASFQTCQNLLCMSVDDTRSRVAVGGEGSNLQLWDLSTQQEVFHAKGGKPNKLNIVDTPFLTALAYLPGQASSVVMVGTAKHKLWLYDARAGKRPQLEVVWGQARVTALAPDHDGKRVWAANGTGTIEALDLGARKMIGALKGAGGSIRSLAMHPEEALVASVGLDRYLRVHDTRTRACVGKVYLKQQLTGVAWTQLPPLPPPARTASGRAAAGEEEDADAEDITHTKSASKQRRRSSGRESEESHGKSKKKSKKH